MPRYCKAYKVKELRAFDGWDGAVTGGLSDDDVCYVWDDLRLTRGCFGDSDPIFDEPTDRWKTFCAETLKFEVPADCKGD